MNHYTIAEITQWLPDATWQSLFGLPIVILLLLVYKNRIWEERKPYYEVIIYNLEIWAESLSERSVYFLEPGSDMLPDYPSGDRYKNLVSQCSEARAKIKEAISTSTIYMSDSSVNRIQNLLNFDFQLIELDGANCESDYVNSLHSEVSACRKAILKQAKSDNRYSRYWNSINILKILGLAR